VNSPINAIELGSMPLARQFYERPAEEVARALLGKVLVHGKTAGRIVEVEAYLGREDRAAHAWHGITSRTRVLFGAPGYAYVYFIYGMYECLNVVAEPEGSAGCILVRALEPLAGLDLMRVRRPACRRDADLASGPGKLTLAMGISRKHNGADLTEGELTIRDSQSNAKFAIEATPRIGIRHERDRLLRFVIAGSPFASR
jgi:DNA-3-methyladenine glycosylase